MALKIKKKPASGIRRKSGARSLKRRLKRSKRSTVWLRKRRPIQGKLLRKKVRRLRKGLRRKSKVLVPSTANVLVPAAAPNPIDTSALYQEGYNESYQEGFNAGFAQGFEDGHKLAYQNQESQG
jgi:hypothetical protein